MHLVELANEFQQVMGCGVDVAAEFGDLVTEFLAVRLLELGRTWRLPCKNLYCEYIQYTPNTMIFLGNLNIDRLLKARQACSKTA
jgi:hypothetical protein